MLPPVLQVIVINREILRPGATVHPGNEHERSNERSHFLCE